MNETLVKKFLKLKGLTKEFNEYVKKEESNMRNTRYDMSVMIGDADFFIDMSFVVSDKDLAFLREWAKALPNEENKKIDWGDEIFSTGYESHEKYWWPHMFERLFNEPNIEFLEGKDHCFGTSYEATPTDEEVGDDEGYFYERLANYFDDNYNDLSDELKKLYDKTDMASDEE